MTDLTGQRGHLDQLGVLQEEEFSLPQEASLVTCLGNGYLSLVDAIALLLEGLKVVCPLVLRSPQEVSEADPGRLYQVGTAAGAGSVNSQHMCFPFWV